MKVSEVWNKGQKQELLDEIERLKKEVEKLKKQTPQELVSEIESHEEEVAELKKQVEQLINQLAQIEIPPKDKGLKSFFKFGGKK